jgi:hypothetical protein
MMKKASWQYLVAVLLFTCIAGVVIIGFLLAFVIPGGPVTADSAKYFLGLHRHDWGDIHFYLGAAFVVLTVVHLFLGWKWIRGKTRSLFGARWGAALVVISGLAFVLLTISWLIHPGQPGAYDRDETGMAQITRQNRSPDYASTSIPASAGRGLFSSKGDGHAQPTGAEERTPERAAKYSTSDGEHPSGEHESREEGYLTRGRGSEDTSGILVTGQMTLYDIERQTGISARAIANHLRLPRNASLDERLGRLRKRYSFTLQELREVVSSLIERRGAF